jgi:REP element-mobilizing transposase RayT
MPGSYHSILVHIVFSTKDRQPWLTTEHREGIFAYMATILRDAGSDFALVNGHVEHAHVVCSLPVTLSPGDFVRKLKSCSSKWIRTNVEGLEDFRWQSGYAAFSFSRQQLPSVCRYVEHQQHHHQTKTFEDEYREFLALAAIEYDEQHLFG